MNIPPLLYSLSSSTTSDPATEDLLKNLMGDDGPGKPQF